VAVRPPAEGHALGIEPASVELARIERYEFDAVRKLGGRGRGGRDPDPELSVASGAPAPRPRRSRQAGVALAYGQRRGCGARSGLQGIAGASEDESREQRDGNWARMAWVSHGRGGDAEPPGGHTHCSNYPVGLQNRHWPRLGARTAKPRRTRNWSPLFGLRRLNRAGVADRLVG